MEDCERLREVPMGLVEGRGRQAASPGSCVSGRAHCCSRSNNKNSL